MKQYIYIGIIALAILFSGQIISFAATITPNFPTSLDAWDDGDVIEDEDLEAIQAKIGIDNSAVTSSLDYLLKNSASIDPGHLHTSAGISGGGILASDGVDFEEIIDAATLDANWTVASSGFSFTINADTVLSEAITLSDFTNCDTIDTDGSGVLSCGTDATGAASNAIDFDEVVDSMTLDANLIVASGSGPYNTTWHGGFFLQDTASVSGKLELDGDVAIDTTNGIDINPGSDTDADLITVGVTGTPVLQWDESQSAFRFTEGIDVDDNIALTFGTGFDATLLWDGTDLVMDYDSQGGGTTDFRIQENSTDRLVIETGGALSVSANASHSFTGDLNIGDDLVVDGSIDIPSAAGGPTINAEGEIGIDSASGSFNFHDGTSERVVRPDFCKTWAFEDPTETENWGAVWFPDPVTVLEVSGHSSGSDDVTWNLKHGAGGSITTDLFSADKSASNSTQFGPYTTFNDATILDNNFIQLEIASGSSIIENLDVTACFEWDA